MRFMWNIAGMWWVGARREDSRVCQQALAWLRSLLANIKTSWGFLLQSCGPAAASLQMVEGKKHEKWGGGSVSESLLSAAFTAANGALVVHMNLFRWWLQLKGRVAASSPV